MNLFELFFKIGVKDEASGEIKKLSNNLGNGLKTAAKVGLAAVGAAATGVAALTKQSLESYAEYEQLVGGVETLFKESADTVLGYANEAYITAGLSANQYMSTVTSFSASLLQSLDGDTQAAADLANQALIDMSDNANKMGTDMSMIQNAYQGFAKQNYTMLDNLKLGYGGTQTEMRRLIKDAAAMDDSIDASSMSFANIVKAIKVVQDEMGITGTTSNEAATTIQGSVNMAKAAWENLKVALADENGDVEAAADRFVDSVGIAAENIMPKIKVILKSLPRVIRDVGPIVIKELPGIVKEITPDLADAAAELVVAAIEVIPSLSGEAIDAIDEILAAVGDALKEKFPQFSWFFDDFETKVWAVVNAFIAFKTIKGVTDFISTVSSAMKTLATNTSNAATAQSTLNTLMGGGGAAGAGLAGAGAGLTGAAVAAGGAWLITEYAGTTKDVIAETKENVEKMKENNGELEFVGWEDYKIEVSWWDQLLQLLGIKSSDETVDGSHRFGLSRVPYDGYIAELHEGERVLTRSEARDYRGSRGGNLTVNINIDGARYDDEERLADAVASRLQKLLDGEDAVYA